MPSHPYIFDEAWAASEGVNTDVVDVVSVYMHFNDLFRDDAMQTYGRHEGQEKGREWLDNYEGLEFEYSANVAVTSTDVNNEEMEELDGKEVVMLALGQDNKLQYDGRHPEDDEDVEVMSALDSFSEGWALLRPDEAREIAQKLSMWADVVEMKNEIQELKSAFTPIEESDSGFWG